MKVFCTKMYLTFRLVINHNCLYNTVIHQKGSQHEWIWAFATTYSTDICQKYLHGCSSKDEILWNYKLHVEGGSVHDIEAMKLENNCFPPVTTMDALSCLLLPTLRFRNFYIRWRQVCRVRDPLSKFYV